METRRGATDNSLVFEKHMIEKRITTSTTATTILIFSSLLTRDNRYVSIMSVQRWYSRAFARVVFYKYAVFNKFELVIVFSTLTRFSSDLTWMHSARVNNNCTSPFYVSIRTGEPRAAMRWLRSPTPRPTRNRRTVRCTGRKMARLLRRTSGTPFDREL